MKIMEPSNNSTSNTSKELSLSSQNTSSTTLPVYENEELIQLKKEVTREHRMTFLIDHHRWVIALVFFIILLLFVVGMPIYFAAESLIDVADKFRELFNKLNNRISV